MKLWSVKAEVSTFTKMTATAFEFSSLVFGTWRLADKHSADPADILARIKECISLGINTFDLADVYVLIVHFRGITLMKSFLARRWH